MLFSDFERTALMQNSRRLAEVQLLHTGRLQLRVLRIQPIKVAVLGHIRGAFDSGRGLLTRYDVFGFGIEKFDACSS